jgi:DNA mismatch endonuclease, patch repair protein
MADIVDVATRSRMMAGIQSKNTKPEIVIRKALHTRGFRYSLHSSHLPGKPDIVMPKWRVVIFVHGCFWHWHGCHLSKIPATRTAFWTAKLAANQKRDALATQQLLAANWRVATVWECATRGKSALDNLAKLIEHLTFWIRNPELPKTLEIGASEFLTVPAANESKTSQLYEGGHSTELHAISDTKTLTDQ